jgi:regulatory protein
MHSQRQPAPPLDQAKLRSLALYYVGRFATTRGKLTSYLRRKVKERGWKDDSFPNFERLVEEFSERGYINDQSYAEGKTASLKRKGMGSFRIKSALQGAGIESELINMLTHFDEEETQALALDFARKRRMGPFAERSPDERLQKRWMAAFLRAGHKASDARLILSLTAPEEADDETF